MYAVELYRKGRFAEDDRPQPDPSWANAPAIDLQNVADFLNAELDARDHIAIEDYPECVPPWPQFLAGFYLKIHAVSLEVCTAVGLMKKRQIIKHAAASYAEALQDYSDEQEIIVIQPNVVNAAHRLRLTSTAFVPLVDNTAQGRVIVHTPFSLMTGAAGDDTAFRKSNGTFATQIAMVIAAGCSFANCKNTQIVDVPLSRQVRRHAERTGEPIFAHKVLEIKATTHMLQTEGKRSEHGNTAKAMHICRGAFHSYGEKYGKGKLFGKHEGRFWVPQHVRGTLDRGLVTKDYIVKAANA
jgi:hypothetical protein